MAEAAEATEDRVHLTLPLSQQRSQRQVPAGLVVHYADLRDSDRGWYENVPVTTPRRTLLDCVASAMNPGLLRQALEQAVDRGLLDASTVTEVAKGIDKLEGT